MKRFNVLTKVALAVVVSLGMMVAMGAKAQAADKIAITDYDGNPVIYVNDVFDDYYGDAADKYGNNYSWNYDIYYSDWGLYANDVIYSYTYDDNIWGRKYIGSVATPYGKAYVTLYYDIYAENYYDEYYEEWEEYTSVYVNYTAYIPLSSDEKIVMYYYNDDLYYYSPECTTTAPQFYAANSAAINKLAKSKLGDFVNCINATF